LAGKLIIIIIFTYKNVRVKIAPKIIFDFQLPVGRRCGRSRLTS
jgi:hypothetical protein